jgi:hypothetical protein
MENVTVHAFRANAGAISGKITNITTGDVGSYSFYAGNDITGTMSYIKTNGAIYNAGSFKGKLINSEFDCRGKTSSVIIRLHSSAEIERCKLLSDSGYATITATSATASRIVYTITNRGFTNATSSIIPNYNINNVNAI